MVNRSHPQGLTMKAKSRLSAVHTERITIALPARLKR